MLNRFKRLLFLSISLSIFSFLCIYFLGFKVKAEPFLEDDSEIIRSSVSFDYQTYYVLNTGTPKQVTKHNTYYVYIPNDLINDMDYIQMQFLNGYTTLGTITLLESNTNSKNVFMFNANSIYDWALLGNNIVLQFYSARPSSLTEIQALGLFKDNALIIYPTEQNLSRLNIFVTDIEEIYNEGYQDGYDIAEEIHLNDYNVGFSEGESYGRMQTVESSLGLGYVLSTAFGGIGQLLGITLLPGIAIGAIVALPLVFGIMSWLFGLSKGGKK